MSLVLVEGASFPIFLDVITHLAIGHLGSPPDPTLVLLEKDHLQK
jgi:hypothetical protein